MNFAFVNATKKWGGVKTWCLDMAVSLREQGHGAIILGRRGAFVDKARSLDLPAWELSFGFDLNPVAIARCLAIFVRNRVDVVVVNVAKDLRTAGVAARLLGLQVVQHVGSGGDFTETANARQTQRLIGARFLCCSAFVVRDITLYAPFLLQHEVIALHPGTKVPLAPAFAQHHPPVIIATSQLNADKYHADLLGALAVLHAEGAEFQARIVGTGSLAEALQDLAEQLGIAERVQWVGFATDVAAELERADIFVLPTLVEPLGIALQEAMAHGLAPVARNAGGVPEIWPPACAEYLVPAGPGPEGLLQALRKLLALPPAELLALRRAAWEHARTHFEIGQQAARFAKWVANPPVKRSL
jgi:glycosyltransferase involved in cell wall biosynthesis